MRALIQRVTQADVSVGGEIVGAIGSGLVVLLGVGREDDEQRARRLAEKVAALRVFAGGGSHFDRSALDVGAEVLVISQFTLYGDTRKGRRPSFTDAASPEVAEPLIAKFVEALQSLGLRVATGQFGALMLVRIFNDGPVTFLVET